MQIIRLKQKFQILSQKSPRLNKLKIQRKKFKKLITLKFLVKTGMLGSLKQLSIETKNRFIKNKPFIFSNLFKNFLKLKKQRKKKRLFKRFKFYKQIAKKLFIQKHVYSSRPISRLTKNLLEVLLNKNKKKLVELIVDHQQIYVLPPKIELLCVTFYKLLQKKQILTRRSEFLLQKKFFFILFRLRRSGALKNYKKEISLLLQTYTKKNIQKASFVMRAKKSKLLYAASLLKLRRGHKKQQVHVYDKLVGLILKKGKKALAIKILEKALYLVRLKLKRFSLKQILRMVLKKLKVSIELKKVRVRRSFHLVPFPINMKRKIYLVVKWILFGLQKSQQKNKNLAFKLHVEILNILNTKYSFPFKRKQANVRGSLKNLSNAHFRW